MNKKNIIPIIVIVILIVGGIYFFNIRRNSQYCNHKLNWDGCDGKIIKISGKNPDVGDGVMQHPMMILPSEIVGNNSKQYQNYLDTKCSGQIVLLSDKKINCPKKMTIIGTLKTNVGPCNSESITKGTYCGSSITVHQWQCN